MPKYFREKHKFCEFGDAEKAKNINKTLHHVALSPRSVTLMCFYIKGFFQVPIASNLRLILLVGWSRCPPRGSKMPSSYFTRCLRLAWRRRCRQRGRAAAVAVSACGLVGTVRRAGRRGSRSVPWTPQRDSSEPVRFARGGADQRAPS